MARVSTGFKYYGTLEVKLKTKMISRPLTTRCFRFFCKYFFNILCCLHFYNLLCKGSACFDRPELE